MFNRPSLGSEQKDHPQKTSSSSPTNPQPGPSVSTPPSLSLPKGGGAIRGIGEKFAANPVTGTGSLSVPIVTSPGRSGFGPQLSLSYDSAAGSGLFGFGWTLSLPTITRKTDKGLPQYRDGEESDVFVLSGAEDLVPLLVSTGAQWEPEKPTTRLVAGKTYTIKRYRPRIEGLFARIERWTEKQTGEIHWRSITRDNITTLYGKDNNSRIFDPNSPDPDHPTRIFSWLICESYDDKGNAIIYSYEAEDDTNIDHAQAHERNRVRTANRYLKRIRYGNRVPNRDTNWEVIDPSQLPAETWMFEVVLDYGEHRLDAPTPGDTGDWLRRNDPFSSYRAGFEVRTYRLCQRVLMFHHFPKEPEVGKDCLVRSTDFTYSYEQKPTDARNPIFSFLLSITQSGYKRKGTSYHKQSLPPLEFAYTPVTIRPQVEEVDAASLENLPIGLDGTTYQWVDLDGEGLSGILTEQAGGWFYKRNLSPQPKKDQGPITARLGSLEVVAEKPAVSLTTGETQFLDLAGDGSLDLVQMTGPVRGFYERSDTLSWLPFRPFTSWPTLDIRDPNLRFIDLNGDGHADILITEQEVFTWYPSLAEAGFGPAQRVWQPVDEEHGPRLVFADSTQSISLADMSGDGLTDLVRIRNGEVCYWPNLGYGRFGAKVIMDNAPWFDVPEQFDQKRIRLADIDGSGVTDIIYLGHDSIRLCFNQSGNSWSDPYRLTAFPRIDNLSSVLTIDLLGNGTACLVWSSPLPGEAGQPMRYIDLMGGQKPHLLTKSVNNLGAETLISYAPSTKFYLDDQSKGKPWITKIPFPVHVVERVETWDHISRNRFVTRYAYHHGYFDGEEREFRGFGMVEQWDTEEFAALSANQALPVGTNVGASSHVPPVLTRTWFHTGVSVGRQHVSNFFAGLLDKNDVGEYYRELGLTDEQARQLLLEDTVLPTKLTPEEEREACRALKGSMLRQEVYALDSTDKKLHPYTVTEQNFTIRCLQPQAGNRHAVFFTHPREAITYHYERNPTDPRVTHTLTLEVDGFGNVLKEVAIGYGRRKKVRIVDAKGAIQEVENPDLKQLAFYDQPRQTQTLVTYTENRVTNAIADVDSYRTPLPSETRTYELTDYRPTGTAGRFQSSDFVQPDPKDRTTLHHIFDSEINYEEAPSSGRQRRLIEHVRTLYRPDDLGVSQNDPLTLLPLGRVQSRALLGAAYKLAFTPGLLGQVYQRPHGDQPCENLLPNPAGLLPIDSAGRTADRGGYLSSQMLRGQHLFPERPDGSLWTRSDADDHWWIPTNHLFYSPTGADTAAQEHDYARLHFFLPQRYRDPFHSKATSTETCITYDAYDLLVVETRDALGNVVTAATQDDAHHTAIRIDYRVLQPYWLTDPNGNRTQVTFDALGMVVGTAVMGRPEEQVGDSLDGFEADIPEDKILAHLTTPFDNPHAILGRATTRLVYDLCAYCRTKAQAEPQPAVVYSLARETHAADLDPTETKVQHSFSYSDGFGREIQKKIQAEPETSNGIAGLPRWVGSGWTIFNNKGKPVRQYEPFFSDLPPERGHCFEFGVQVGVSSILFYDPVERVVATLHPNHSWEKVVFDPWRQETWDVNDTVLVDSPNTDPHVGDFFRRLPADDYLPTWHALRTVSDHAATAATFAACYPDLQRRASETRAAQKTEIHATTPTVAYFDTLGRPFLTIAHNSFERGGTVVEEKYPTRVMLDIEGNQREVRDAVAQKGDTQGRVVMRYDYDMVGNRIHQASMEAGERWMLNDVAGKPIRAWDSRSHSVRTEYDLLRRPLRSFVTGADPDQPIREMLTERLVYGEQHPDAARHKLRGKLYLHLDQAGAAGNENYDFKGNLLQASRRLATEYKKAITWSSVDAVLPANATGLFDPTALEAALVQVVESKEKTYTSATTYDALNRPVTLTTPHTPTMQPSVIRPHYNEANFLEHLDVTLHGAVTTTPFVTNIVYNAKGQRLRIDYGNGTSTFYEYDTLTFRLVHLLTRRDASRFPADCPPSPPAGWPGCQVQNLHYTYDPAGNITHIRDDAQQTIYFRNQRVEPSADYTYDAIYRLIEANGREHLGQVGGAPIPHSSNDTPRIGLDHPGDGNAMSVYAESYVYDEVGNFKEMKHIRTDQPDRRWTRTYTYSETSLIEDGVGETLSKTSNRLSSTQVGNGTTAPTEPYTYDSHGNTLSMPHLPIMRWDYRDQLQATSQQVVNNGGTPEITYYVYDAAGQRVRKLTERSAPAGETPRLKEERIYLGGFELFRTYAGDDSLALERETLHIMDDKQRIALVETRNDVDDGTEKQLIRYQFSNHLGSATLELDDQAKIISYEEYMPYGSTSYQARNKGIKAAAKRYRYTGKERDEESGFSYHDARYYTSQLARWTATDPLGLIDGLNPYTYASNNPLSFIDTKGLASSQNEENYNVGKDFEDVFDSNEYGKSKDVLTGKGAVVKSGKGGSVIDRWVAVYIKGIYHVIGTIEYKTINLTKSKYLRDSGVLRKGEIIRKLETYLEQVKKHMEHMKKEGYFDSRTGEPGLKENLKILAKTTTLKRFKEFEKLVETTVTEFNERYGTEIKASVQRNTKASTKGQTGSASAGAALGLATAALVGLAASEIMNSDGVKESSSVTSSGAGSEIMSNLASAAVEWVQGVGARTAIEGVKVAATQGVQTIRQHGRQMLAAGGAAATTLIGTGKVALLGSFAVSAGAVAASGVSGYLLGKELNKSVVEPLIDKLVPQSFYEWSYKTFIQ